MMVAAALMVTDPNGAGTPPVIGRTSAISRSDCSWLTLIWGFDRSRLVVVTWAVDGDSPVNVTHRGWIARGADSAAFAGPAISAPPSARGPRCPPGSLPPF